MLKKRRKKIEKFTIETDATRKEDTPRALTAIHCKYIIISADISEEELYKIAKLSLEKYCSVAASLKAAVNFSVEVIKPS